MFDTSGLFATWPEYWAIGLSFLGLYFLFCVFHYLASSPTVEGGDCSKFWKLNFLKSVVGHRYGAFREGRLVNARYLDEKVFSHQERGSELGRGY